MCARSGLFVVVFAVASGLSGASLAALPDISPEEYQLYMNWKDGREDPRLSSLGDEGKKKKIARSLKVSVANLQAAIDKVGPLAQTLRPETEMAIRGHLKTTPLADRVLEVTVDDRSQHVVAYVKWRCGDKRDVEKEAAYAAWAVGAGGPVVGVAGVWCVNEVDTKMFSGQIGRGGFTKIKKKSILRFAFSRYIRFFEKVKRGPHR